jgi:4'-phosphopantetheinyl transferase
MEVWWLEQSEAEKPVADDWLHPGEKLRLANLRFPKRRADWRLGRWTAKRAVAACLNVPSDPQTLARIEIRSAESGAPEVFLDNGPSEVSISITHSNSVAACAVGPSQISIGCDLELIEPRSNAFLTDYLTEAEQALVKRVPADERAVFSNLLWSAKESALKLLRAGLRLDTRCVEVTLDENSLRGEEDSLDYVRPWHSLTVSHANHDLQGWWMSAGEFVRTIVTVPSSTAPRILSLSGAENDGRQRMQRVVGIQ